MPSQIQGIHHVTTLASSARANNSFFTETLGLRRVKKTVNFDAPDIYHLYYGNRAGTPGTVMTSFPFPHAARGRPGTGEVGTTAFSIPRGSAGAWSERLARRGVADVAGETRFGESRLHFAGPDGESLALVEADDGRTPWTEGPVGAAMATRGFHSVVLRLADEGPTADLLGVMGYREAAREGGTARYVLSQGNGAHTLDIELAPGASAARYGAGSVHHVAFAVATRAEQLEVREALSQEGCHVTPPIDRDYFWAIYFRSPGGVLFEIATNEPGFERDEDVEHLGETLRLPAQHAHLREKLERQLEPID